jgi:hypothetical protein
MKGRETKSNTKQPNHNQNGEKREEEKRTRTMTSKMAPPMPQVLVK